MIRIDLGKGGIGSSKPKAPGFLTLELPTGLKTQLQKAQLTGTTIIVVGIALALSCLFPLFSNQYEAAIQKEHEEDMKSLSKKLGELNQQIETYTPFKRELQSYEDQKKLVSDRLAVVRKLLEQRNAPVNTLDAIAQSLPQRVWLQTIDAQLEGAGGVTMVGSSYSNEEISDFIDTLSRSIYLTNVNLEDVTPKTDSKVELKMFNLTAVATSKIDAPAQLVLNNPGAKAPAPAPAPAPAAVAPPPANPGAPPAGAARRGTEEPKL